MHQFNRSFKARAEGNLPNFARAVSLITGAAKCEDTRVCNYSEWKWSLFYSEGIIKDKCVRMAGNKSPPTFSLWYHFGGQINV